MFFKKNKKNPQIEATPNGPFMLFYLDSFEDQDKNQVKIKSSVSLCRCGHSENKPFCDGTHTSVNFNDKKDENRLPDVTKDYVGHGVIIHDNRSFCTHVGHCTTFSPEVFDKGRKPWIIATAEEKDKIINTVRKCPSGALTYSVDGVKFDKFHDKFEVKVVKNGPINVRGGIRLIDSYNTRLQAPNQYCLCRCGASTNKPLCDGTHRKIEFKG